MSKKWMGILGSFLIGMSLFGAMPIARSVCLLKSPAGSGSGFFASFAGMDVVITNNHVMLEMPGVRILDINGNEYEYDFIYSSPERDLAIIPVKRGNQDSMPNLPIHTAPDMLEQGMKVEAYGDSLGDGVVTQAKGKFLGIGPAVLEVDAGFVQGNSGGPVVDAASGAVIGVSTYLHIIREENHALRGSRFEADRYKSAVRRFATRIDNMKPEQLEKITRQEMEQDQAVFRNIQKSEEKVREILADSPRHLTLDLLRSHFRHEEEWVVPEHFHTTYLKKEAEKKAKFVNRIRSLVQSGSVPDDQADVSAELRKKWLEQLDQVIFKVKPEFARKCPNCRGSKKVQIPLTGAELEDARKNLKPLYEQIPCGICHETGKLVIRKKEDYALVPAEFSGKLQSVILAEKLTFNGFSVGSRIVDLAGEQGGFYGKKQQKIVREGVFTVSRFPRNHEWKTAQETRFWFLGDLLMRIDVVVPVENPDFLEATKRNLKEKYAGLQQGEFVLQLVQNSLPEFQEISRYVRKKQRPDTWQERELENAVRKVTLAAAFDPFGVYCPVRAMEPGKGVVMFSMQHKTFDTCGKWMKCREKGLDFSPEEPAASSRNLRGSAL